MTRSDPDSPGSAAAGIDYVERAQKLAPQIEVWADQAEADRRLPEPLLAALFDAGLFRLLLPRSLQGAELDPVTFVHVMEEVAKADASTAWCIGQTAGCSMIAAYLRPDVAAAIFARHPRALLAWGPGPDAKAVAVEGGYQVTGTWSFASGCRHATWLGGHCPVYEADGRPRRRADGAPAARTMLFPVESARLIDVWQVGGLKATGTDAFTVSDLFVPHERSAVRDDPTERLHRGPLYCFPIGCLYASGFAAVALGIARRMLDALIELARDKTPRGFKSTLRESAVIQSQVAQAEAQLGAARIFLVRSLEDIWRAVEPTGALTLEQRVRIRLASTYAIHQAKEVADVAHHAAGATSIFTASPFDRRFRDIHAVTQQMQGRQAHFETVGQFLLGLDPDTTWL